MVNMSLPIKKNFIGSSRYGVSIKLKTLEFAETMPGELALFDGKHPVEKVKFTTFDQMAKTIMDFWERSLGLEVSARRFANWLTEYLDDLGVANVDFYNLLDAVRGIGKGVKLQSSGVPVKEVQVRFDLEEPVVSEEPSPAGQRKLPKLEPVGTYQDPRQLEQPMRFKEEEKERRKTVEEEKTVLPVPEQKIEIPPEDRLVKPSELFKKKTVSPTVSTLPPIKEEKKEPELPEDRLLKPSEVLKQRETIEAVKTPTRPLEPKPAEIKTKVVSQPEPVTKQQKLAPPEDRLLKPSEYLKKLEKPKKEEPVDKLVTPSTYQPKRKGVEKITLTEEDHKKLLKPPKRTEAESIPTPSVKKLEKPAPKEVTDTEIKKLEIETKTEKPTTKETRKVPLTEMPKPVAVKKEEKTASIPKPVIAPEPTPKPTPKVVPEGKNIEDIKGVGAKSAELLREAGYDTISKIANATPEELSKIKGIGLTTAKRIIENAKNEL